MWRGEPTLRLFAALILGATPPLVVLTAVLTSLPAGLSITNIVLLGGSFILLSVGWIAAVAAYHGRAMQNDIASLIDLAETGERSGADDISEGDAPHPRLTALLEERDRQVTELASQVSAVAISAEPGRVAAHLATATRRVTGDPTWSLAVLDSTLPDLLPPGLYEEGAEPVAPVSDLHQWAAVSAGAAVPAQVPVHLDGPWGAFVVVVLGGSDDLRAVLLAPWEGRARPMRPELAVLTLLARHAATAIEHSLLYARSRLQAQELDTMAGVQRDFLRAVSHDLQTPLTSLRAVAHELAARPDLDQQARTDLDLIAHQADRLRRMVAQLLAVSRLEAGSLQPRQEIFTPRPLVERTWDALRPANRELKVTVSGKPMLVVADPDRLEQVTWAVLDNAVKYSPPGSPVHVELRSLDGSTLAMTVRDEGAGMDEGTRDRAFDQFYRGPAGQALAPDGSGIGLYAARGLVMAMGGRIELESSLGHGTTVRLILPAEPVDSESEALEDRVTPAE